MENENIEVEPFVHYPTEALERKLADANYEAGRLDCPSMYRAAWKAIAERLRVMIECRSDR